MIKQILEISHITATVAISAARVWVNIMEAHDPEARSRALVSGSFRTFE
jgi:hypothetical protein